MEAVVGPYFSNDFIGLRELIDSLFTNEDDNNQTQVCRIDTEMIAKPLSRFMCHVTIAVSSNGNSQTTCMCMQPK